MSTALVTPEDYKFFDFLAPYRWPNESLETIALYRTLVETGEIQIETLLENALAVHSAGKMTRVAQEGHDFYPCLSDAKKAVSCFRRNNKATDNWMNSITISGLKNKVGLIRALCYSKVEDTFYCIVLPHSVYTGRKMVEMVLFSNVGYKEPTGVAKGKWVPFIVNDFNRLATITPAEAELLIPENFIKPRKSDKFSAVWRV
jgi:hypothetical protein